MVRVNPNENYMPIVRVNTDAGARGWNAQRPHPMELAVPFEQSMGLNTFLRDGNALNLVENTNYTTNDYSLSEWDKDIFENYKKFKMYSDPKKHIVEANQKHIKLRQEFVKKFEEAYHALLASGNCYSREQAKTMAYQMIQGEMAVKKKVLNDRYVPASSSSEMNQMLAPAYQLLGNDARVGHAYNRYHEIEYL